MIRWLLVTLLAVLALGMVAGGALFVLPHSPGGGAGAAAGSAGGPVTASPSASVSPTVLPEPPGEPAADDLDPRCKAQYGDPHRTLERVLRVRPTGWPRTPPEAVLCRVIRVSATEEVGCYATDPGTKIHDIFWYYDHAITAGVSGYAPVGSGQQILTGVLGDASFYIEQPGFDRYVVVWATDGDYDDAAALDC